MPLFFKKNEIIFMKARYLSRKHYDLTTIPESYIFTDNAIVNLVTAVIIMRNVCS